jgi:hypothetical protein
MLQAYETDSLPFFAQRLEKLVKICRDHGIEPVFLTQPTLYGPGLDPVTGVNSRRQAPGMRSTAA